MKPEQTHIDQIRTSFEKMQSREDLLHLLNEAKPLVYGDKAVAFELKQLTWYANPKLSKRRYVEFKIKKKSGKDRTIHAPVKGLKAIQKTLNFILQCVFEPHKAAMGFTNGKSIVDNARLHTSSNYVFNIDLKDFFLSIDQARVWKCLQLKPFNLVNQLNPGTENATLHKINIKQFTTTEGERIYYKIKHYKLFLINDRKGNLERYKKRIEAGVPEPPTESSNIFEVLEEISEYNKRVKDRLLEDAKNYVLSGQPVSCKLPASVKEKGKQTETSKDEAANNAAAGLGTIRLEHIIGKNNSFSDIEIFGDMSPEEFAEQYKDEINQAIKDHESITNPKNQSGTKPNDQPAANQSEAGDNNTGKANTKLNIANIIASLCCTEIEVERKNDADDWQKVKRNVLPQGAPTSPVITNIVCQRLDYLLSAVAKRFGLKYSRYADDITFSSMHNVYQPESDFLKELHRIIAEQGFHIKESKTRLQKEGYRQQVTGLLVNDKINVQKRYIKQLRMWLYYWERYGYNRAYEFFLQQYLAEKGGIEKGKPDMANVIGGKLDYLKMVKGAENDLYLKLIRRFDVLTSKAELINDMAIEPSLVESGHSPLMKLPVGMKAQTELDVVIPSIVSVPQVKKGKLSIPIIHNPKVLVTLLKNFSVNDSALKYTTHSWDAGRDANMFKDLTEFLTLAREQYKAFSFQLKTLSENLNGKIFHFLFNKDISLEGWGTHRIKFGWSSPELLKECNQNPDLNPEDIILPSQYQLQIAGRTIQKFKHVIDIFKNEIEIRDENSALLNLILQKHDTFLLSFAHPIITNLDNKTFYTDAQWLSKALDLIFENIQNRSEYRQIRYTLKDEREDAFVLEILQIDSFNIGMSINDEKLKLEKGNFGDICKYLKNLCDWSIESQFAEGCFRINYLVSEIDEVQFQKIERADGFKHILTFYK